MEPSRRDEGPSQPAAGATQAVSPSRGRIHSLQVSDGGVPKRAVPRAEVTSAGLSGDRQHDLRYHGGPDRAVCVLALEVIAALAQQGHPIAPGTAGENVTVAGLDWAAVVPGRRLRLGSSVLLLVTGWALPCGNIRASFSDGDVARLHPERAAGRSRVYTRVLAGGTLSPGDPVELLPAEPESRGDAGEL